MTETPIAETNSRDKLMGLLDELGEHPERIEDITDRIEEIFGQERTIMVLDMSGFTRATQQGNIISFLLSINQMQRLVTPVVQEHGGLVVSAEHDNLTCLFDSVEDALDASDDITGRLGSANVILPSDKELYCSIGIGFGRILNVGNDSIYGNEVNLASKLGEDIGDLRDVLLTPDARARVKDERFSFKEHTVSVSGLELTYFSLETES